MTKQNSKAVSRNSGNGNGVIPQIHRMETAKFRATFQDAAFNPPGRIKQSALRHLIDSMKTHQFISTEPIRVHAGVISDGHRRLHAAILAEVPYIYYVETTLETQEYWAVVNGTSRAPTVKEAGVAVRMGLKVFPANRQRVLTQLQEVAGSWKVMRDILAKASPGIIGPAQRIVNFCFDENETSDTKEEFTVRAIQWLLTHKQQMQVKQAIAERAISPEMLFEKIIDDKPLATHYA